MCEPVYGVSPQFRGLSSTVPMPTNMLHIDLVAYVIQLCPFSYTAQNFQIKFRVGLLTIFEKKTCLGFDWNSTEPTELLSGAMTYSPLF